MAERPPNPALSQAPLAPGLYLVATPIGNLRDITLRALDVLAAADLVLAEDTRVTGKLLSVYGLSKRLERYDEHAAARARPKALAALVGGGRVALVSDAGTPLVSDPGYRLVAEALAAGAAIWPIPGPSAALAALSVAGLGARLGARPNHHHHLALRRGQGRIGGQGGQIAAHQGLVQLGQLPGHRRRPGTEHRRHVGQRGAQALGALEEDQRRADRGQFGEQLPAAAGPRALLRAPGAQVRAPAPQSAGKRSCRRHRRSHSAGTGTGRA